MKKYILVVLVCVFISGSANAIMQCISRNGWDSVSSEFSAMLGGSDWWATYSNGQKIYGIATCAGKTTGTITPGVYTNGTEIGTGTMYEDVCLCMVLYPARTPWIQVERPGNCWTYCANSCAGYGANRARRDVITENFGI